MSHREVMLPRSIAERLSLGVTSLLIGGMFGFGLFALYFSDIPPFGLLFTFILLATKEIFWATTIVAVLLLLWAIATPAWVERLFVIAYKHLWIAIALGFAPIVILMVLAMFGLKLGQGLEP